MSRALKRALNAWLRHEDGGGDRLAEEALYRLFGLLPRPSPAPGFVEAVLRRAGIGGAPLAAPSASWGLRFAAGLALALAGAGIIVLPGLAAPLLPAATARLADLGAGLLVGLLGGLPEGASIWRSLAGVGRAASLTLESPPILAALLSSALIGAGALGALRGLMFSERSTRHVGTF